MTEIFCSKG